MEILHPANIDLFQVLDTEQYEDIVELISLNRQSVQLSSSTLEDLFIATFFKQRNQYRINQSNPVSLFFGIVHLINEVGEKEWVPVFKQKIKLIPDPYKNGIWNIKTAGKLKLSNQLISVLEKDSEAKNDYPPLLRLKDIIQEDTVDTFKAFLNPSFLHKNTQLRPFPTLETLQSDLHNDFYLTAVLNSAQKVAAESYIKSDTRELLQGFHRTPKNHSNRKDLEVSYPFMDSEQRDLSTKLEDRKLALVNCSHYADMTPVINQLIVQGLENGERILVLTDRRSLAQKLYDQLPINQKVLLPKNWKTDIATRRILKNSIASAQISEKANTKNFLLHKQKTNRSFNKVAQYSKAFSSPIFGDKKWMELIGLFLKHHNNSDKSILSAQLNSTNFEFSFAEYGKLSEKLNHSWPIYSNLNIRQDVFFNYQEDWFTKTGKQQTKKQFIELGKQIRTQTQDIQKNLQHLIDTYSESYRDQLDIAYLSLNKKIKTHFALLEDFSTTHGNQFLDQKLKSSSLNPFVSKQTKLLQKHIKQLENHYIDLCDFIAANTFCEFQTRLFDDLKTVNDLEIEVHSLNKQVEEWRTNSFNLIQDEIKRFSKKHHLNSTSIAKLLPETEEKISAYFLSLKELNLYTESPKDYLLTYTKRLKQFNKLFLENEEFLDQLEHFETLYDWTRNWHLSASKERELIEALIETKAKNWDSAFNSWYLNKFIERNLSEEKTLNTTEVETASKQIFNFFPLLLDEIGRIWSNKLAKAYYALPKRDKKKLDLLPQANHATKALNENQFTDLFQQAFPLCFSSNLEYWDSQDNALQFDRIIIIELAKVRASIAPALCSRSKSIIMFSRLVPNDPDSMAYYLDQMPLVRKLNLTGKYYNTCINLSQAQPHVLSRSFSRKIELHTTQGIFDVSKQINEKEADTVIHLLNTIEINKQTRIYTKTGILCFSKAQRNLLWSYVRTLAKRQDETGEKVRQLERNGLQIGCLDDLLGMDFERIIVSTTFSYLDNETLFVNPFEFTNPKSFLLGLNWCKYNKAKHIDLVYSSFPDDCIRELSHNPGALLLVNFLSAYKEMQENIPLGGSYYFKDFNENLDYANPLAVRIQSLLRQFYPINQLRLDYELFGLEFPLAILPEDLNDKPNVLVFDRIISTESEVALVWDHYFLQKLKEEGFGVIHINTIDFWRKPEQSLNELMDTLKSKERLSSQSDLE